MSDAVNLSFEPVDNARLANLCGAFDENLRQIETALEVNISRRGERFTITGAQAGLAREVMERFYLEAEARHYAGALAARPDRNHETRPARCAE